MTHRPPSDRGAAPASSDGGGTRLPSAADAPLLDEVVELEPDADPPRIVARKRLAPDEPFFAGHFPGMPVAPGVLMLEALVSAGRVLADSLGDAGARALALREAPSVRFRRRVEPGEVLELRVSLAAAPPPPSVSSGRRAMDGRALVDGQVAVEASLVLA